METNTERYPIDYDTLNKGDTIPAARIERITGKTRTDLNYALACMALKERIETDLWKLGKPWTLKQQGEDIVVLTDAEAAEYNDRRFKQDLRSMGRRLQHQLSVDVAQLDDDQRADHLRAVEVNGKIMQAVAVAKKQIRLEAHQRQTPRLESAGAA
jgi:hypothetical protein